MPRVFDTCDVEDWDGQDARDDGAAGDQNAELFWFFKWVEAVVLLDGDVEVWAADTKDGNEEEEHRNGCSPDGRITNGRKDADSWLSPTCAEEVLDEETGHGDPEAVVHEVDHHAAWDRDHGGVNADVGFGHVVDVIVGIRDNGCCKGADEAAHDAGYLTENGKFLLSAWVDLEVVIRKEGHCDTLLSPQARGQQDPQSSVVGEKLFQCLAVFSDSH